MEKRGPENHHDDAPGVKKQRTRLKAPSVFETYKSWNEIPLDLQCRVDIARMAMEKQWVKHISELPAKLQQDDFFRRHCIIEGFKQRHDDKTMTTYLDCDYKELSTKWKKDRSVISAAFQYNRATLEDIPETFLSDDNFLRQIVHEYPRFFSRLPPHIRNDTEYWLYKAEPNARLVPAILETHSNLTEDSDFWYKVLENNFLVNFDVYEYGMWIERYAPERFQLDHKFMLLVMRKNISIWLQEYGGQFELPILQDKAFVTKLLQHIACYNMQYIPKALQRRFPDLMAEIVIPRVLNESMKQNDVKNVAESMDLELWIDFDIVKSWFSNKGSFMERAIPQTWNLDTKSFLWIAEHCKETDVIQSFERAPKTLRADKSFMMQVIELEPKLYGATSKQLQDDIDLRMMVCSKVSTIDDLLSCGMSADVVKRTHEHIQERYKAYQGLETYRSCVSHHGTTAPSTLLNQGPTTSFAYNSLFAEYLGVPTGNELRIVRKCAEKIGKAQ